MTERILGDQELFDAAKSIEFGSWKQYLEAYANKKASEAKRELIYEITHQALNLNSTNIPMSEALLQAFEDKSKEINKKGKSL